jgi:hypothetical protein
MHRAFHYAGWAYVALCTVNIVRVARAMSDERSPVVVEAVVPANSRPQQPPYLQQGADAAEWFRRARPYCNAVEVNTLKRWAPAPDTPNGVGYQAACFALAGRIDDARHRIDVLPASERPLAAEIVFEVGHPVADAGDDRSAGPIMELVVDYIPNHYMALYHAGMAEYMLGQHNLARKNLEAFLQLYSPADGWRSNAIEVLHRLKDPGGEGREARRPREPGS